MCLRVTLASISREHHGTGRLLPHSSSGRTLYSWQRDADAGSNIHDLQQLFHSSAPRTRPRLCTRHIQPGISLLFIFCSLLMDRGRTSSSCFLIFPSSFSVQKKEAFFMSIFSAFSKNTFGCSCGHIWSTSLASVVRVSSGLELED